MARGKPIVSRTFAPIHFEDLDPHRFEDLVRELIYDFRDWQTIEATGRSGDDAGFDIRAFEKQPAPESPEDDEEPVDGQHPMEGPRWMIQGKREKTLTPSNVKKILADVDADDPPYGYILAASAVFSRKSYDVFRDELRKKGVMEFYLWGRSELEDKLHLPKNDRILFTFFGISLVSRRRSRTTEIRSAINTKNKLYKLLGDPQAMVDKNVLIRDINDAHYPFEDEYADFAKNPRWITQTVYRHHPIGLMVHNREFFAFVDRRKKEWDYTKHTDTLALRREYSSDTEEARKQQEVFAVWNFLPRAQQGTLAVDAFLPYADILLVDPNGDGLYDTPHLYVAFTANSGPYSGFMDNLSVHKQEIELDDSWRRIDFFPKAFPVPTPKLRVHRAKKINLDPATLKAFTSFTERIDTLYAVDDRFDYLRQRDIVAVANSADGPNRPDSLLQVNHKQKTRFLDYINDHAEGYRIRSAAQRQVEREIDDEEVVTILEVERAYISNDEEIVEV